MSTHTEPNQPIRQFAAAWKRTRRGILVAVLAVATTSGCAVEPQPSVFLPTVGSSDSRYLAAVRSAAPTLEETPDAKLTETGRGVCTALGDGHTADELSVRAVTFGLEQVEGEAIIENAIANYCPDQNWFDEN